MVYGQSNGHCTNHNKNIKFTKYSVLSIIIYFRINFGNYSIKRL